MSKINVLDDEDKDEITGSTSVNEKLIIKKENKKIEYHIHLDTIIDSPNNYRNIFEILRDATREDKIIFHLNTPGGWVDTMIQFFYHFLQTKAETKATVYSACSAGAIIALCCDTVEITPFGYFMIHSMDIGMEGKISDVHDYSGFAIEQNKNIIEVVFQGFLTKQEIQLIAKGKEIWLNKTQIDKRLKNWKSIKQRNLI